MCNHYQVQSVLYQDGTLLGETLLLDYGQNIERFGVLDRVKPELEDRKYHDQQALVRICEVCETVVSVYKLECAYCIETLRDDDIGICNKDNDRYAEFCELCGEELEDNMRVFN